MMYHAQNTKQTTTQLVLALAFTLGSLSSFSLVRSFSLIRSKVPGHDPFQHTRRLDRLRRHAAKTGTTIATEAGMFPLAGRQVLDDAKYDVIVVGSGNGACGFLNHYLKASEGKDVNVLVLERGQNYFFTSDITHQNEWTKSYANGPIFKLHNTLTRDGKPILSGGACTMGGGGSINYTMIHEASTWLDKHLGHFGHDYWNRLKGRLNKEFKRENPSDNQTPVTSHIIEQGVECGFARPDECNRIENIPNQDDDKPRQLYQFPTQFNKLGQRTNSGVSIVDWDENRIRLETGVQVEDLEMTGKCCTSVKVKFLDTKEIKSIKLKDNGKVILCAGAATPRLLMKTADLVKGNQEIGKHVSDHIAMPLGIYTKPEDIKLSPKDIYGPIFATLEFKQNGSNENDDKIIVSFDFFTGKLPKLLYLTAHLYLAFLLPNFVKKIVWRTPWLFELVKNFVRIVVSILNVFINVLTKGDNPEFITAIIKYNPAKTGEYDKTQDGGITLGWFEDEQDKDLARTVIRDEGLKLLEHLGGKPIWPIRFLYRLATKVPYDEKQIDGYIRNYSDNSMLSQQHLAGGCLLGCALETGEQHAADTGKVKGSDNIHVADLSAVPLPRISPQMTAYLIGYHVANQLYKK